jgi:hypothetical protein
MFYDKELKLVNSESESESETVPCTSSAFCTVGNNNGGQ